MLGFMIPALHGLVHVMWLSLLFKLKNCQYCQDAKKYIKLPDIFSAPRSFEILPDLSDLAMKLPT